MPSQPFQPFHPFRSERARLEYDELCAERARDWPVPVETHLIDTKSGTTFVRICGRASDPPLVLLPGARAGSLMWTDMIATLSSHHRTYALDIAGDAGLSVRPGDVKRYEQFVDWLDEVAAVLVPKRRFGLMGVSLGGAISAQYALRHPERLQGVVLVAPAATALRSSPLFFVRLALLSLPILALSGSPLRRTLEWLFSDAVRGDMACRLRAERAMEDARRVVQLFKLSPPPWPPRLNDDEWRGFGVPCLFLVGENEKIYSARAAVARLGRVAPRVKAEVVPGAGHDLTIVYPGLVARKAVEFLAERGDDERAGGWSRREAARQSA
jgi:pimeloyl-ACP methyl ester carboxylesterase